MPVESPPPEHSPVDLEAAYIQALIDGDQEQIAALKSLIDGGAKGGEPSASSKTFSESARSGPPGPPPRPGLVWKGDTHRWRNPDTGEEHEHSQAPTENPVDHAAAFAFRGGSVPYRAAEAAHAAAKANLDAVLAKNTDERGLKTWMPDIAPARERERLARENLGAEARKDMISLAIREGTGGNRIQTKDAGGTKWMATERTRRLEADDFVADMLSKSHGDIRPVAYSRPKGGRAYYDVRAPFKSDGIDKDGNEKYKWDRSATHALTHPANVCVNRKDDVGTYVHELGHHLENSIPGAREKVAAFLAKRLGDEPLVPLSKKFPGQFDPDEEGRKDDFAKLFHGEESFAYYIGKPYETGDTEVLSMGLELMYRDPKHFAKTDPEYFNLIINILQPDRKPA